MKNKTLPLGHIIGLSDPPKLGLEAWLPEYTQLPQINNTYAMSQNIASEINKLLAQVNLAYLNNFGSQNSIPEKRNLDLPSDDAIRLLKEKNNKFQAILPILNLLEKTQLEAITAVRAIDPDDYLCESFGNYGEFNIDDLKVHFIDKLAQLTASKTHSWNFELQKCDNCSSIYWDCMGSGLTCDETIIKNLLE